MHSRFTGFALFPPGKCNLVVAKFEAVDKELHAYAEHLLKSAETVGLTGLREKHNLDPHVTLGKINATKVQVGALSKHGGPNIPDLDQVAKEWTTDGCYLCGKVPPQAFLDWNFTLSTD
jgi:2'-5' RNA ligase